MPKVIFNIGYTPYNCPRSSNKAEHASERAFYNGTAQYNYFNYTEKDGKVVKDDDNLKGTNYMEKTSGVFNKDGVLSSSQKAELAQKLKETKSIIWHGFISFDDETSPYFNSQEQCIKFINRTMNSYFERNGLKMDDFEFFCSLHSDTDHRHIHFAFFEKEPKMINRKTGKLEYRQKGTLGDREYILNNEVVPKGTAGAKMKTHDYGRESFLLEANLYLEENKYDLEIARRSLMDEMSVARNDILTQLRYKELRSSLIELNRKLPNKGRKGYNSKEMKPYRPDIDKVASLYLDTVPGLRLKHNELVKEVFKRESAAKEICKREDLSYEKVGLPTITKLKEDLKGRIGNTIIKLATGIDYDVRTMSIAKANDLTRKIQAKNNRRTVERSLLKAVKVGSHNGTNYQIDYSVKLHQIEAEIEYERQKKAAYGA